MVPEAGWGLTTKGTGSRQGWAGHPFTCDGDLTVPASPSGGAEHRQWKCPQWALVVGPSQCLRLVIDIDRTGELTRGIGA